MAYRALDDWTSAVPARRASSTALAAAAPSPFTPLELRVIALAATDSAWSIGRSGRLTRLLDTLFGLRPGNGLADPRLEALRRFAVLARLGKGRLPDVELDRFFAAGFTAAHARRFISRFLLNRFAR